MSATSSLELLKAHAVISRSWLLAQIEKRKSLGKGTEHQEVSTVRTDNELVRWFDREDHTLFDVCADDHCQRYQGITKATSPHVKMAIDATRGQVLFSEVVFVMLVLVSVVVEFLRNSNIVGRTFVSLISSL